MTSLVIASVILKEVRSSIPGVSVELTPSIDSTWDITGRPAMRAELGPYL